MPCNGQPTSTREGYHAIKNDAGATAVVPTNFIRSEEGTIEFNKTTNYAQSKQNERAQNIQAVPGQEETTGTIGYSYDANESIFQLYGVLGDITSVDVSSLTDGSVYSHTIVADNCLPSFTYEEAIGRLTDTTNNLQNYLVKRSFGATVNTATLKIEGDRVMIDSEYVAKGQFIQGLVTASLTAGASVVTPLDRIDGLVATEEVNIYDSTPQNETPVVDAIDTAARTATLDTLANSYDLADVPKLELIPQTPSYTISQELFSSGTATVRFGADLTEAAAADPGCVRDFNLAISNDVEQTACLGSFSAAAGGVVPKGRTIDATFTRNFMNKTDMDRYIQAKEFAMIITIDNNAIVSSTDTNEQTYSVEIKIPKVSINTMPITAENNGIYEYTASVTAVPDASEGYDLQVVAYNAKAGTYYTA